MYNKKGQAALEFLMTYGWAILAAIIVIGSLGTWAYLNQGGGTSVIINSPFYGVATSATGTTLSIELENKGGEDVNVTAINVTGGCVANDTDSTAGGFDGAADGPQVVTLVCAGMTGSSFSGDISVTYLRPGSALPLTVTGSLSTPIVA